MDFNKSYRHGFTLIETLVGVTILAILATVAAPNMECLIKEAEDSEAKVELAALKSAEQIHYAQYKTYSACLKQIGYRPRPDRSYTIGFSALTVTTGQPRCGKSPDPKTYTTTTTNPDGTTATTSWQYYGNLNCNTWGNQPGNTCLATDAAVGDPDSASDINYAANTKRGNSILMSYRNMNAVTKTCTTDKQVLIDPQDGRPRYTGCWGGIINSEFEATAFRGRTGPDGITYISGYVISNSSDKAWSFESRKEVQGH